MHPELLNNSQFLRYYKQWQDDPQSIVFAPLAEYFLKFGMMSEALGLVREGLKKHPDLVSGRIVMAKIHIAHGNWEEAEEELSKVLGIVPENEAAKNLLNDVTQKRQMEDIMVFRGEKKITTRPARYSLDGDLSWNTVTMASIYVAQGHRERARIIYESILKRDPENRAAREGLEAIVGTP